MTRYFYNGLNRLQEVVYEADGETVTYAYNALGNRTVMTDSLGITTYEYDTLSRIITATSPLTGTVIYGYDLVGNQTNLAYPGGKVITTTYNADGQKETVTDWDGGVTAYTYDAAGRLATTTLPNGVQTTTDYDPANRLTGVSHVDLNSGALQAAYLYELDKRGHNTVVTETMRLPDGSGLNHQVIVYDYDPLYRITEAAYTGVLSGTYAYEYNAVGSRVYYSTNITHTETTTYTYNIANQLQESKDLLTAELTTYDWDDAGRLITTTVASVVDKVYQYSQDGDLTRAEVDGLVTTFAYDGDGSRLQMSVAGETTTYLPDYGGRSSRILFEQGTEETKQYLYGVSCLGEFVTDNATNDTEWRYYQRDAKSLVRQTTNEAATITLAWTFSPEGGVLLGEEGPVTHLGCGDDAVYDWSTGLIFKNGGYFDPNNGIWITMGGAMIWQSAQKPSRRKRRMSKKVRYLLVIFLLLVLVVTLTGCDPYGPECPTPPSTPTPGEEPRPPVDDDPTRPPIDDDPTDPPIEVEEPPIITPIPIDTPTPEPNPTPYPYPTPPDLAPSTVSVFGDDTAVRGKEGFEYKDARRPGHNGVDVIPSKFYGNNAAMVGAPVYALYYGHVARGAVEDNYRAYLRIGATASTVNEVEYELMYSHINVTKGWADVAPGEQIGTIMNITLEDPQYTQGDFNHLHLEIRKRAKQNESFNPEFLLHPAGG